MSNSRSKQIRAEVKDFQDIPNVGKATAGDFRVLGFSKPQELAGQDPYKLYDRLCELTGERHDPCVIDVFIAAVRYMEGAPKRPWWEYTPERKAKLRNKE